MLSWLLEPKTDAKHNQRIIGRSPLIFQDVSAQSLQLLVISECCVNTKQRFVVTSVIIGQCLWYPDEENLSYYWIHRKWSLSLLASQHSLTAIIHWSVVFIYLSWPGKDWGGCRESYGIVLFCSQSQVCQFPPTAWMNDSCNSWLVTVFQCVFWGCQWQYWNGRVTVCEQKKSRRDDALPISILHKQPHFSQQQMLLKPNLNSCTVLKLVTVPIELRSSTKIFHYQSFTEQHWGMNNPNWFWISHSKQDNQRFHATWQGKRKGRLHKISAGMHFRWTMPQ